MKARLPAKYQTGRAAENLNAMRLFFIICGFILHNEFQFGEKRLNAFYAAIGKFFEGEKFNKTLADEAEAWAKKHNILQEERA